VIKDLRPGDPASVGPYRLLGRLGVGGMGEVYLAKSPGGRLVAIKLIRPELAEERGFRSRFSSEISAARNVSGIYTAAVVDADPEAELPWMATVYVPGPSLTDAVEDNGPLPVKSVLALAAGLAEALQAIHRAGLVHRDLKPSNVLLANDGPRVIDFGISLALERSMMTATGMVMGSPGFMSPEQARGQREVGAPTDMFSFGAVLAFAATGSNPFGDGPTPALLYRVVNELPDLAGVPARLSPLIEQCLAKDPADRPTPAEVLASLGDDVEVLTGEWLPQPIAETMARYSPTLQTPLPPALREAGQPREEPESVPASLAEPGAVGFEPTVLGAVIPASAAAESVSATRVEQGLLPETSLVPVSGPFTAAGRDVPGGTGGTGGMPPTRPPSRLRRWRWLLTAAAAVIIVAVAAILLTSRPGGSPKVGGTPAASLDGDATQPSATAATTGTPSKTPAKKKPTTSASQSAGFTPGTQAPPTRAPSSTPASRPTPTLAPAHSATPTPTSSASPTTTATTSPTPTPTTTTATPTSTPTATSVSTAAG
jgi:serine/threonine protein kinase